MRRTEPSLPSASREDSQACLNPEDVLTVQEGLKDTANDGQSGWESTRREYLQYGDAVIAGGLLVGCTGGNGSETTTTASEPETTTAAAARVATETETEMATEVAESYSVSIEPVGEVMSDSVPEAWIANSGSWAGMGVAFRLDTPMGVWLPGRYHTQYYDEIPDVSADKSPIRQLWDGSGVGKEQFYELNADVHIVDPDFLLNRDQWNEADIEEISTQVGSFFSNSTLSRDYAWHEDYRHYTLYEAFEKFTQVSQCEDRFGVFEQVHEEFQSNLASVVPAQGERPSAAVVWIGGDELKEFYPYVIDEGMSFKHLNDLKVSDAFTMIEVRDFYSNRDVVDFETLFEVDPEALLVRGQEAKTREEFQNTMVSLMKNHEAAGELTAVQNGDVYRAGALYQSPITNLIVTDCPVRTLYDADERLFDVQCAADIASGNL